MSRPLLDPLRAADRQALALPALMEGARHLDRGDVAAAAAAFNLAHEAAPQWATPLVALARASRLSGDLARAEAMLRQALDCDNADVDALNNLAGMLIARGALAEAIDLYQKAADLRPHDAAAQSHLIAALLRARRGDEARMAAEAWTRAAPDAAMAWARLCDLLVRGRKFDAAVAAGRVAVARGADNPAAWAALSRALNGLGEAFEARSAAQRGLWLRGDDPAGRMALAQALISCGLPREGMALAQGVRAERPNAEADQAIARARFLLGDMAGGWADLEVATRSSARLAGAAQRWQGEDLAGQTIAVLCDQSLSDAVHLARYARRLVDRGAKVALIAPPELAMLQLDLGAGVEMADAQALHRANFWAPILAVPGLLDDPFVAMEAAYLHAPHGRAAPPALRAPARGKRIGLVWDAGPREGIDAHRALPFERVLTLAGVAGTELFGLQTGPSARAIGAHGAHGMVTDLSSDLGDWGDLAAAIAQLDLVISVDSATAHLAAAMAKPVWLLTPFAPDWRWGLGSDACVWYPSMRLYRQTEPRNWTAPMARARTDLTIFSLTGRAPS
jgi:tetratricopeptide (TPR) repeat protein